MQKAFVSTMLIFASCYLETIDMVMIYDHIHEPYLQVIPIFKEQPPPGDNSSFRQSAFRLQQHIKSESICAFSKACTHAKAIIFAKGRPDQTKSHRPLTRSGRATTSVKELRWTSSDLRAACCRGTMLPPLYSTVTSPSGASRHTWAPPRTVSLVNASYQTPLGM